jgi:hypothetical protein
MQPLVQFDGAKRTCATRLAAHNARRRDQNAVRLAQPSPLRPARRARHGRPSAGARGGGGGAGEPEALAAAAVAAAAAALNAQFTPTGALSGAAALEHALAEGLFDFLD